MRPHVRIGLAVACGLACLFWFLNRDTGICKRRHVKLSPTLRDGLAQFDFDAPPVIRPREVAAEPKDWQLPQRNEVRATWRGWSEHDLFARRTASSDDVAGSARSHARDFAGAGAQQIALDASGELEGPSHTLNIFPIAPVLPAGAPESSKLMFGFATTSKRAREMSTLWTHWLTPRHLANRPTSVRPLCLILLSPKESDKDIADLENELRLKGLGKICHVRRGSTEFGTKRYEFRVLSLTREMRDLAESLGRPIDWYIWGDDDTVWLDLRTLQRTLSRYSPDEPYYVGASTESVVQEEYFFKMAFGGAGILVSRTLYDAMYENLPLCFDRFTHKVFGGDEMLIRCAAYSTNRKPEETMTEELGLHQLDIKGDGTGFMSSGFPTWISLHHFNGWEKFPVFLPHEYHLKGWEVVARIRSIANFLGGDNVLQRYVFGGGHWTMVPGYSITFYEQRRTDEELTMIEHTWQNRKPRWEIWFPSTAEPVPEARGARGEPAKRTWYLNSFDLLSPRRAVFTYSTVGSCGFYPFSDAPEDQTTVSIIWDLSEA